MPSDNNHPDDGKLISPEKQTAGLSRSYALAMELPFILVAAVAVGGLAGHFLDIWLHSKPYLMLVLGALGFIGGMREMLRRLSKL